MKSVPLAFFLILSFISSSVRLHAEENPPALPEISENLHRGELPPGDEFFREGLELREAGRYGEAESAFQKALHEDIANPDYNFELANLYAAQYDEAFQSKEYERADRLLADAARQLEQAVMIRPDFTAAEFNLGVVYKKQGRYEDARNRFKKIFEQNPENYPALLQVGQTYQAQGFYDEAEAVYEQARDELGFRNPDVAYVLEDLAQAREQAYRDSRSKAAMAMNSAQNRFAEEIYRNRNPRAYAASDPYQQQGGGNAGLGSLGGMMLQQFMQSRAQKKNRNL